MCLLVALALTGRCAVANQWLWQADNHTPAAEWDVSKFTDGVSDLKVSCQGPARWCWDDPYPGVVTYRQTRGWMADNLPSRGFANSSDFGEAFDLDKGVTVAARVWPIHAQSQGTLCFSAANRSTQNLPGGSTYVWVGWTVPDGVAFFNSQSKCIRRFKASVAYDDKWTIWTFSAKRVGDTVAWDLWIDGEHQAADQPAPDGTSHTLVYTDKSESGNTVRFGQRAMMQYPCVTVWDYVAVTNEGVIPGWNGNAAPAKEPEQPVALTDEQKSERLRLAVFREYMSAEDLIRDKRYKDVVPLCEKALKQYETADPGLKIVLWLREVNAYISLGKAVKALQLCDDLLTKYPGEFDAHHLETLRSFKGAACESLGHVDEAASVYDDMIAAVDASVAALLNPPVYNPGFEEIAKGNDAPGCAWQCWAKATMRSETTNPHSGSRCMLFTNASPQAPNVYARLYQMVGVLPATKYELSLWVRGEDVAPGSHLTDWGTYTLNLPEGTFGWRKVSTTFTTKDGQGALAIGINVANTCKLLAVDDMSLRAVETPDSVRALLERRTQLALHKGDTYFRARRYREATAVLRTIRRDEETSDEAKAEATYRTAVCYRAMGMHRSAAVCMDEVATRYPRSQWSSAAKNASATWERERGAAE